MTRKIKIYSILLGVIYIIMVGFSLSSFIDSFHAGVKEGQDENSSIFNTLHVHIEPKEKIYTYPDKIINTLTGQNISVESNNFKIRIDATNLEIPNYLIFLRYALLPLAFVYFLGLIYLPFFFFRVINKASKGKIMEPSVVQKIRFMGYITLVFYLLDALSYLTDYLVSKNVVAFEKYNIIYDLPDSGLLYLGIVTLLMAEILKISSKLKEDQDLTI